MLPLRLVIDTNVLISSAIKPAGLQRSVLLLALTRPARLYVSRPILEEYSEVLGRPELRIRKGLRQQLIGQATSVSDGHMGLFLQTFAPL
jgi:predicted nucleic acid-binding protein